MNLSHISNTDCLAGLKTLPDECIDCCVTSPPYFRMRDYGVDGQVGLEDTPEEYVSKLVEIFHEVFRVLKKEGTLWLNIGDCYNGSGKADNSLQNSKNHKNFGKTVTRANSGIPVNLPSLKPKDLIGIPWMVAFALRSDGWYLRNDIIWKKINPVPEPVRDRCTKSHEHIFLVSKSRKYYYDYKAILEKSARVEKKQGVPACDGLRNKRDVWTTKTACFKGAHFATFPEELIRDCIKAGCPAGGVVLDPFMGTGTTAIVARALGRHYIGFELNPKYVEMANRRLREETAGRFN